jgi:hypothetical protein
MCVCVCVNMCVCVFSNIVCVICNISANTFIRPYAHSMTARGLRERCVCVMCMCVDMCVCVCVFLSKQLLQIYARSR